MLLHNLAAIFCIEKKKVLSNHTSNRPECNAVTRPASCFLFRSLLLSLFSIYVNNPHAKCLHLIVKKLKSRRKRDTGKLSAPKKKRKERTYNKMNTGNTLNIAGRLSHL